MGDMDQNFFIQGLHFIPMSLQIVSVFVQPIQLIQHHPALNAPIQRGWFVLGKVNTRGGSQQGKNAGQRIAHFREELLSELLSDLQRL